jgi:hypothetical protein
MRVSLTARYMSHPMFRFERTVRRQRPRLGLERTTITYHRPRAARHALPTVAALRSQTARFHFGPVGSAGRVGDLRSAPPLGLPRAHRA